MAASRLSSVVVPIDDQIIEVETSLRGCESLSAREDLAAVERAQFFRRALGLRCAIDTLRHVKLVGLRTGGGT